MKKVLALILAAVCTVGMQTVSFAAESKTTEIEVVDTVYTYSDGEMKEVSDDFIPGRTYYFPIINNDFDYRDGDSNVKTTAALSYYNIKRQLHDGDSLFSSAAFVVKTLDSGVDGLDDGSAAFLAVTTKRSSSSKAYDVDWEFTVVPRNEDRAFINGDTAVLFGTFTKSGSTTDNESEDYTTVRHSSGELLLEDYQGEKVEISFDGDARFRTTVSDSQDNMDIEFYDTATTSFNRRLQEKYSEAELDFYLFRGDLRFSRTGNLYLSADEDDYIYKIEDETLKSVPDASYSRNEGAFVINTNRLANYVVSDKRLSTTSSDSSSSSSEDVSSSSSSTAAPTPPPPQNNGQQTNPNTGANDWVGLAVALGVVSVVGATLARKKK